MVTSALSEGAVQLTEIVLLTTPPTITCGWLASELHSRTLPIELLANPDPVRVTALPLLRPVVGLPVIVVAAKADMDVPRMTEPPTTSTEARIISVFAQASHPRNQRCQSRPTRLDHDPPPVLTMETSVIHSCAAANVRADTCHSRIWEHRSAGILIFDEVTQVTTPLRATQIGS